MKKKKNIPSSKRRFGLFIVLGVAIIALSATTFYLTRSSSLTSTMATVNRPVEIFYLINGHDDNRTEETIYAVDIESAAIRTVLELGPRMNENYRTQFTYRNGIFVYAANAVEREGSMMMMRQYTDIFAFNLEDNTSQILGEHIEDAYEYPVVAPDTQAGRWVAYTSQWTNDVYVANTWNGEQVQLPPPDSWQTRDPVWSNDGTKIAVTYEDETTAIRGIAIYETLFTADGLDFLEPVTMFATFGDNEIPVFMQWSTDNTQLAYIIWESTGNNPDRIVVQSVTDGIVLHSFDVLTEAAYNLAWSPDMQWLIYEGVNQSRNPNGDLHLIEITTGKDENITLSSAADDDMKTWLPTGDIVYQRDRDIMVMDFATREVRQLVNDPPDTGGYHFIEYIGWRYTDE
jgi:Tol biopolymer transport system component